MTCWTGWGFPTLRKRDLALITLVLLALIVAWPVTRAWEEIRWG